MIENSPTRQEFRGIRSNSFDDTPRRTRIEAPVFTFPATTIWNNILTCFVNEGPRLCHRRQFTYVDDSFTGKEAVDFMMVEIPKVFLNGRAVTRKNCTDLLQKFLEKKVFYRYKVVKTTNPEREVIKDSNTLYVHNRKKTVCRTPILMLNSNSENRTSDEETTIRRNHRSSSFRQAIVSTTHSPTSTPSETSWNRRASMSHGNLSVITSRPDEIKEEYAEIQKTPPSSVDRCTSSPSPTFMEGRRTSLSSGHIFRSLVAPRLSMSGPPSNQRSSRLRKQTQDDTSLSNLRLAHRLSIGCTDGNFTASSDEKKDSGEAENIYDFLPFFKRKKKPAEKDLPDDSHVRSRSRNGRMPFAEVNGTDTVQLKSVTKHQEFNSGRKQGRKRMVARRVLTADESAIIWKACLFSRLKTLLKSSDFTFLSWNIDGTNIRTNSGSAKSVRFAAERGGYSSYLTRMMHHLEEFPFTSSNTNVIVVRDNQEVQIFDTLCSNLEAEGSVLTGNEASALLHIVAHVHELHKADSQTRRRHVLQRCKTHSGTSSSNIAGSRLSASTMSTYLSEISDVHLPGLKLNNIPEGTQVALRPNGDAVSEMSSPDFSECSSVVSFANRRRSDRLLHDRLELRDIYALPGFKRSPDGINSTKDVCFTPNLPDIEGDYDASPQHSTTSERADKNPMTENLSDEELNNLLVAFSLVLLTFPLQTRNKLCELIRFLSKVSRNHCLQLSPLQENRYMLLQRLVVPCIVPESSPLTAPQAINLVALLMNNERIVFSVDETLQAEVNARSEETANGQIYLTDQNALNNASTPERNVVQYCQPIERTDYFTQNKKINDYLLPLLDSIIHADMKESERDKKLKVFRKAHPEVYSVRFPAAREKEHNGGFLKRLFR